MISLKETIGRVHVKQRKEEDDYLMRQKGKRRRNGCDRWEDKPCERKEIGFEFVEQEVKSSEGTERKDVQSGYSRI